MSPALIVFDLLLCGTLVGLAVAALTSREPRRGVILFIAFGLLLSLVWARLRAPDIAIAEAAIGAGLAGALLLSAARRAARRDQRAEPGSARTGQ
ncbi:MAG: Na(+)/H(+) antiporter subunit B [Bdellovibrio bacteriovorus]